MKVADLIAHPFYIHAHSGAYILQYHFYDHNEVGTYNVWFAECPAGNRNNKFKIGFSLITIKGMNGKIEEVKLSGDVDIDEYIKSRLAFYKVTEPLKTLERMPSYAGKDKLSMHLKEFFEKGKSKYYFSYLTLFNQKININDIYEVLKGDISKRPVSWLPSYDGTFSGGNIYVKDIPEEIQIKINSPIGVSCFLEQDSNGFSFLHALFHFLLLSQKSTEVKKWENIATLKAQCQNLIKEVMLAVIRDKKIDSFEHCKHIAEKLCDYGSYWHPQAFLCHYYIGLLEDKPHGLQLANDIIDALDGPRAKSFENYFYHQPINFSSFCPAPEMPAMDKLILIDYLFYCLLYLPGTNSAVCDHILRINEKYKLNPKIIAVPDLISDYNLFCQNLYKHDALLKKYVNTSFYEAMKDCKDKITDAVIKQVDALLMPKEENADGDVAAALAFLNHFMDKETVAGKIMWQSRGVAGSFQSASLKSGNLKKLADRYEYISSGHGSSKVLTSNDIPTSMEAIIERNELLKEIVYNL